MIPTIWNKETYKIFLKYLLSLEDKKYKDFNKSIVLNSKYEMIGIRLPIMRDLAKKIGKTNIEEFLNVIGNTYYEEVMVQGLVISYIKEEDLFYKYFNEYIKKVDNWALCDSFCSSIKIVRKYEEKYFNEAIKLSLDKDEFISRIGLIIILNHFIKDSNLTAIFNLLNNIKSDKYYINMAEAWVICELYIKHPKETLLFIKNNNLNKFTQNKAISKIHDSYRVSKEEKNYLNKYKK